MSETIMSSSMSELANEHHNKTLDRADQLVTTSFVYDSRTGKSTDRFVLNNPGKAAIQEYSTELQMQNLTSIITDFSLATGYRPTADGCERVKTTAYSDSEKAVVAAMANAARMRLRYRVQDILRQNPDEHDQFISKINGLKKGQTQDELYYTTAIQLFNTGKDIPVEQRTSKAVEVAPIEQPATPQPGEDTQQKGKLDKREVRKILVESVRNTGLMLTVSMLLGFSGDAHRDPNTMLNQILDNSKRIAANAPEQPEDNSIFRYGAPTPEPFPTPASGTTKVIRSEVQTAEDISTDPAPMQNEISSAYKPTIEQPHIETSRDFYMFGSLRLAQTGNDVMAPEIKSTITISTTNKNGQRVVSTIEPVIQPRQYQGDPKTGRDIDLSPLADGVFKYEVDGKVKTKAYETSDGTGFETVSVQTSKVDGILYRDAVVDQSHSRAVAILRPQAELDQLLATKNLTDTAQLDDKEAYTFIDQSGEDWRKIIDGTNGNIADRTQVEMDAILDQVSGNIAVRRQYTEEGEFTDEENGKKYNVEYAMVIADRLPPDLVTKYFKHYSDKDPQKKVRLRNVINEERARRNVRYAEDQKMQVPMLPEQNPDGEIWERICSDRIPSEHRETYGRGGREQISDVIDWEQANIVIQYIRLNNEQVATLTKAHQIAQSQNMTGLPRQWVEQFRQQIVADAK